MPSGISIIWTEEEDAALLSGMLPERTLPWNKLAMASTFSSKTGKDLQNRWNSTGQRTANSLVGAKLVTAGRRTFS